MAVDSSGAGGTTRRTVTRPGAEHTSPRRCRSGPAVRDRNGRPQRFMNDGTSTSSSSTASSGALPHGGEWIAS